MSGSQQTGAMAADTSWLEGGGFTTPLPAALRLGVCPDTVRAWARAGFIRHVADGRPVRFLLCDDDIDELADLLHGVKNPSLALLRVFKQARVPQAHSSAPPEFLSPDGTGEVRTIPPVPAVRW